MKNILGIDLGTTTGLAYNVGSAFYSEKLLLATPSQLKAQAKHRLDRRKDCRVLSLYEYLVGLKAWTHPDIIIFEDVAFSTFTLQTQLWSSLRAAVWMAFDTSNVECVGVSTLKKFATGHGGATKTSMANYLKAQYPLIYKPSMDDNQVDSAWLWLWAKKHLAHESI